MGEWVAAVAVIAVVVVVVSAGGQYALLQSSTSTAATLVTAMAQTMTAFYDKPFPPFGRPSPRSDLPPSCNMYH